MAETRGQYGGTTVPYQKDKYRGVLSQFPTASAKSIHDLDHAMFSFTTGSLDVPDITYNQTTTAGNAIAASTQLVEDSAVPRGMRCYLTRLDLSINGLTSWTSSGVNPGVLISDSQAIPIAFFPVPALIGGASYYLPTSASTVPMFLGESSVLVPGGVPPFTFTYNATTGVITASGTAFISAKLVGSPVTIMDGTGKGQSQMITANTATTLTLAAPFTVSPADHASTAKDSVLGVWVQGLVTYGSTTSITLFNGGTPFTAYTSLGSLAANYNVIGVSGGGAGQCRLITQITTGGALTISALGVAMNTTTTGLVVSNEPGMNGILDLGVGQKWANTTVANASNTTFGTNIGAGLIATVQGTILTGSPIRIHGEGYFAP